MWLGDALKLSTPVSSNNRCTFNFGIEMYPHKVRFSFLTTWISYILLLLPTCPACAIGLYPFLTWSGGHGFQDGMSIHGLVGRTSWMISEAIEKKESQLDNVHRGG